MCIPASHILPDSEESCFLHSDQFLSLETASKNLSSGENASWVTVRLWKDKLCSFFQEVVLHKIIAACSFLEACMDRKKYHCELMRANIKATDFKVLRYWTACFKAWNQLRLSFPVVSFKIASLLSSNADRISVRKDFWSVFVRIYPTNIFKWITHNLGIITYLQLLSPLQGNCHLHRIFHIFVKEQNSVPKSPIALFTRWC